MIAFQKFLRYWLPVLLWAGLIFYLSSIPTLESGLPENADWVLRKLAHAAVYAVLSGLCYRALRNHRVATKKALLGAVLLALVYAFSDEYHQLFVPGRHGRLRDVGIDALGILVMISILRKRSTTE